MNRRDFHKERVFYTELARLVSDGAEADGVSGVIIPGGMTPIPLYQRLYQQGLKIETDFRFILSDERHCLVKSPDSNQGAIIPLLTRAGVARHQIIVPDVTVSPAESAQKFNEDLGFFLGNGGNIETAILGIGSDGHTAGMFDDSSWGDAGEHAVVSERADGMIGITCTAAFCRQAKRVVFVLRGAAKEGIVDKLVAEPSSTVAGRLAEGHPNVEMWFCLE